jgi:hypothetical protein
MRSITLISVALLAATVVSCDTLDVTNPNNPSRETVVRNSQDVLALISNGLLQWFNRSGSTSPGVALSVMADEFSTGFADFGGQDLSREPREAINNGVPSNNPPPHHATFPDYFANIAALNQALRAMKEIPVLKNSTGQDVTVQAHAFAKFMQGLNHGYAALMHDQSYVFSETVDSDTLEFMGGSDEVQKLLRPYKEVMDTALAELSTALQLAGSKTFTYPATAPNTWFLGYTRSNQDLVKLIHTYMARLMVYVARTPQERQAVKWTEVLQHLDQGITSDFEVMGVVGVVESAYKNRAARQRTTTPGDFMRVDYRVVGPSDKAQGYINWWAQPWAQRNPFRMTTPDKRIDGLSTRPATCERAPSAASCGLYMGYHNSTVFNVDRGLGQRSFYFFHRYGGGTSYQSGPIPIINVAELDLIRAEGLIRLNRAAEAVPLINKYRVTNGQLPPVTVDGVPGTAPDCAPRKISGQCGSLWDALMYEKRIETMGLEGGTAFYDARAWNFLVQNTPIHFPVPLRDLELLAMPVYTFGGASGTGGAPAPAWEQCPVSLPRCP